MLFGTERGRGVCIKQPRARAAAATAAQPFREIEKEKAGYHWKAKPELGYDAELGLLKEQRQQVVSQF